MFLILFPLLYFLAGVDKVVRMILAPPGTLTSVHMRCDASWEFYQTACNLGPGDPATDHIFLNQLSGVFSANIYKMVRETDCEMISSKMFNGV